MAVTVDDMAQCAFCGRDKLPAQIVRGPEVDICDACVWLCAEILEERGVPRPSRAAAPKQIDAPEGAACALCAEPHEQLMALGNMTICGECSRAAAMYYLSGPMQAVAEIWECPNDEAAEVSRREGLANAFVPGNAEAHADLAHAYAEMKLITDALIASSIAVLSTTEERIVRSALRVLLGGLDPAAIDTLRSLLGPTRPT